ncbi:MAG: ABC transporter ATP-binding protein/permease [Oscillospiraceae bacterium]|nr:ABC transporter ATP-binding protein/permease [Oscillospiraceae bacterium]
MLKLDNIVKVYETGGEDVTALRGVSLSFRENEFVAILGHSGCGKTTLLNIVGGLDQYTSGDLIINGRSTKEFRDHDWDAYRNHSIGFVFQSYNLIPHQSVLANVELALTLSGVSKGERRRRAAEALKKVGLADQIRKRPNQLSGGQMQRVAIARALVNDPDILLADEPTGALDSETSVQVMDLLAEIAREKLVIMVTHNPELAEKYATRTIRLLDGQIVDDSAPYDGVQEKPVRTEAGKKKPSMSFFTAFSLSLNNLMTKKGRTILTSFAGSIGIIGIALILSLSSGINRYINQVQEETLSSYPITIMAESTDMSDLMVSLMGAHQDGGGEDHDRERVYSSTVMYDMLNSMMNAEVQTNNLRDFKKYLDQGGGGITDLATVQYSYDFGFDIYTEDEDGEIVKSDVMTMLQNAMSAMYGGDYSSYFATMGSMYERMDVWEELLPGNDGGAVGEQVKSQYDLLYGKWPESYDEVILFVSRNNEISDLMLYALGLMSGGHMTDSMTSAMNGETLEVEQRSWSYEELCAMDFKLLLPAEKYQHEPSTDTWVDMSATDTGMDFLYNSDSVGTRLKVVGVARPSEESTAGMVTGAIGYTSALTTYAIETTAEMDIVKKQMADEETDVICGLPFPSEDDVEPLDWQKEDAVKEHLQTLSDTEKAAAYMDVMSQPGEEYVENVVSQQMEGMTRESIEEAITAQYAGEMGVDAETVSGYIADMDDETLFARIEEAIGEQVREQYAQGVQAQLGAMSQEQLAAQLDTAVEWTEYSAIRGPLLTTEQFVYLYDNYMPPTKSNSTYEDNLNLLGYVDLESPSTINIYASTFAEKDQIADKIADYNDSVTDSEDEINYTDYVALLMSSITDIISGISYLLIAFVSISLVVSSIMIGIITYISVLERTKEIGILRAVGASKRDVSRVFNAETLIVGLGAGLIGIGVTLLLIIPINAALLHFTGIAGLKAALPVQGAVALVAISALLTIIAGLIPSRVAAKKDPVVALRTE